MELSKDDIERLKRMVMERTEVPLHPDLKPYINTIDGVGWKVLQHPLVYAVPYHEIENARLNIYYTIKSADLEKSLQDEDYEKYVFLHERPYRLNALEEVECNLTDEQYWRLVHDVWIDTENAYQNHNSWKYLWSSDRPNCKSGMDEDEVKFLESLPDKFTIYRGFNYHGSEFGMSWTINYVKAAWFATRFGAKEPQIAEVTVLKEQVISYLNGRGEQEIIVNPDDFTYPIVIKQLKV